MAATTTKTITLNNGTKIPAIGFGGGPNTHDFSAATLEATKKTFAEAVQAGYRHFDGALQYGTEKIIGEVIRESGIPREEFFITTKVPMTYMARATESLEASLGLFGLDYVDLLLIHSPLAVAYIEPSDKPANPFPHRHPDLKCDPFPMNEDGTGIKDDTISPLDTWKDLEKLYAAGKAKAIGVSNFSIKTLEKLLPNVKVTPAVNQIETHPYLTEEKLVAYCAGKGIVIEAYTPGGRSELRDDPTIVELAKKYSVTANQVILAWHVARGTVPIPKSTNPQRIKDNLALPSITDEDVKRITGLNKNQRSLRAFMVKGTIFGWTPEDFGWDDLL